MAAVPMSSELSVLMETALPGSAIVIAGRSSGQQRGEDSSSGDCLMYPDDVLFCPELHSFLVNTGTSNSSRVVVCVNVNNSEVTELPHVNHVVRIALIGNTLIYTSDQRTVMHYDLATFNLPVSLAGRSAHAGFGDGVGNAALFRSVYGLAVTPDGRTAYVADAANHAVRALTLTGATPADVVTLAGNGQSGHLDGVGRAARMCLPQSMALSVTLEALYVGELSAIRAIQLSTGLVRTLAGAATPGRAEGIGANARFNSIRGMVVAPDGMLFASDSSNVRVCAVTARGEVSEVTCPDVTWKWPYGLGVGPYNGLLLTDYSSHCVYFLKSLFHVPHPYHPMNHMLAHPGIREVVLTMTVLWRGRSMRILDIDAAFGLRELLLTPFVHLLRWVEAAMWPVLVTPLFGEVSPGEPESDSNQSDSDM